MKTKKKSYLITGSSGFIGFSLSKFLLDKGFFVIGIDNMNSYYDVNLKKSRLKMLKKYKNFSFNEFDINENKKVNKLFDKFKPKIVINLAAQAGVRFSILNPETYLKSNIDGFFNILDASRKSKVEHFLYASTSSIYGENTSSSFNEDHNTDHPIQFYAATKKSNEVMAHAYSAIYGLPSTGLRFFTVYGPWGRPDMAIFKFTKSIIENKQIKIFNEGNHSRSFTYIDDLVNAIFELSKDPAKPDKFWNSKKPRSSNSKYSHQIVNIGSNSSVKLMDLISIIEKNLGKNAKKKYLPLQKGDIKNSKANTKKLNSLIKIRSNVSIEHGIKNFIDWYKNFYL